MPQWPLDSGFHSAPLYKGSLCLSYAKQSRKKKKRKAKKIHHCPRNIVIISVGGESQWRKRISFQQDSRPPVKYASPFQKPGKLGQWRPGATWGKHCNLTLIYDCNTKHQAHVTFGGNFFTEEKIHHFVFHFYIYSRLTKTPVNTLHSKCKACIYNFLGRIFN